MVSLNYERIRHWIGSGAFVSKPVAELLGVSGFLPVYPKTYMNAWRNRKSMKEKAESEQKQEAEATS
jgi:small subunit ribosomal protein S16